MRSFKIEENLTLDIYNKRVEDYKNNPTSFGTKSGKCMKFVRLLLQKFGFLLSPQGMDAWEFFAGLVGTYGLGLNLIEKKWDKALSNNDLLNIGVKDGSVVFGYYKGSSHFKDGLNANQQLGDTDGRKFLQKNRFDSIPNRKITENVCTHVAYYLNGQLYHVINSKGLTIGPTNSFRAIGWLPFNEIVNKKLS